MTYALTKTLTFDELVAQYVDYGGLGGTAFIGKPKEPTFTLCQLKGEEYEQQCYRLGEKISSPLFPNLSLRLDDII